MTRSTAALIVGLIVVAAAWVSGISRVSAQTTTTDPPTTTTTPSLSTTSQPVATTTTVPGTTTTPPPSTTTGPTTSTTAPAPTTTEPPRPTTTRPVHTRQSLVLPTSTLPGPLPTANQASPGGLFTPLALTPAEAINTHHAGPSLWVLWVFGIPAAIGLFAALAFRRTDAAE